MLSVTKKSNQIPDNPLALSLLWPVFYYSSWLTLLHLQIYFHVLVLIFKVSFKKKKAPRNIVLFVSCE